MVIARHERPALADEEVEIRALARLVDVVEVKAPIAALERGLGCFPRSSALLELPLIDMQLKKAFCDVELDGVAVLHQREQPARCRLRAYVQDHGAVRGAAHARVRDAYHVGDALLE